MKKLVGTSLEHNKQKLLVKIGAASGTVDSEFEVHRAYYKSMVETFKNINAQIEKQIRLASFAPNLSSLAESVSLFYAEDTSQTASQFRSTVEQSRRAISEYLEQHNALVKMVQSSQQELTDLKIRIHERDDALLHYDLRRSKLKSWQEKAQKDPAHNKTKLENAERKYDLSKETYETLNEKLISEIAQLYSHKHTDFEPNFKTLISSQHSLFTKLTEAYNIIYSYMSGNNVSQAAVLIESEPSSSSYTTAASSIISSESSIIAKSQEDSIRVVAIFDYVAKEPNELSFKEHDIITVLDKSSAGWYLGELSGQRGLFPSNFTEPMKEEEKKRESVGVVKSGTATGLYDFPGVEEGELPFKKGDVIQLTKKIEQNGWWVGECNGKSGIFPSNYVRENVSPVGPSTAGQTEETEMVKACFDYDAMEDGELSFKEGNIIEVVAKLEPNGWWRGKLNDKTGIFPSNFVEKM